MTRDEPCILATSIVRSGAISHSGALPLCCARWFLFCRCWRCCSRLFFVSLWTDVGALFFGPRWQFSGLLTTQLLLLYVARGAPPKLYRNDSLDWLLLVLYDGTVQRHWCTMVTYNGTAFAPGASTVMCERERYSLPAPVIKLSSRCHRERLILERHDGAMGWK